MSIPSTDIDALHMVIQEGLAAQFPTATVAFYPRPGEAIKVPGILLELEDMPVEEPGDIGTDQLPVMLNFNAYAVLDYKTGKKQAVKTLAASVMAFIKGKRWGQPIGAATVVGAFPDIINGKEEDYEVMRIEFQHEAVLGLDVWRLDHEDAEGEPLPEAETVLVGDGTSDDPDDYTQIAPCGCNES